MPDTTYPASTGSLKGYLAVPNGDRPWPAVLVIHEAFGLTEDIKRQVDRFAAEGYLAFAPDLYSYGNTVSCLVSTMRTMIRGGGGRALADLDAAREFLLAQDGCSGKVGVIGFCMGGGFAILVAGHGYDVVAPNYGMAPKQLEETLRGSCPMVASYAGKDPQLKKVPGRLESTLTSLDIEHDIKTYDAACHGFMIEHTGRWAFADRIPGLGYHAESAKDAWARAFTFFDRHLR